jgi:hypothetical protein
MFPTYFSDIAKMPTFSVSDSIIIRGHIISGAVAFGLGIVLVVA